MFTDKTTLLEKCKHFEYNWSCTLNTFTFIRVEERNFVPINVAISDKYQNTEKNHIPTIVSWQIFKLKSVKFSNEESFLSLSLPLSAWVLLLSQLCVIYICVYLHLFSFIWHFLASFAHLPYCVEPTTDWKSYEYSVTPIIVSISKVLNNKNMKRQAKVKNKIYVWRDGE